MVTESDVKSRISMLLSENGLTENKLARGNAATQKRLNRQLSHNGALTVETVLMILDACPNTSADWLLLGKSTQPANDALQKENELLRNEIVKARLEIAKLEDALLGSQKVVAV